LHVGINQSKQALVATPKNIAVSKAQRGYAVVLVSFQHFPKFPWRNMLAAGAFIAVNNDF
jgi:hypothetical protein